MGVAAAEFHEAVVATGLNLGANTQCQILCQFAITEFVDVLHDAAGAPNASVAFSSANRASVFSASSGSSFDNA